jgi:hypothetical protein
MLTSACAQDEATMKRLGLAELAMTDEVAWWMCEAFSALGTLRRADAAKGIERRFGRAFVHRNANGNQVIDGTVMRAFRQSSGDAVWDRCSLAWRHRPSGTEVRSRRPSTRRA